MFLWCDEYNELASFMKHIKEYDSRFTYEQVKRICSGTLDKSGVMKNDDEQTDKKNIDSIIVGYKGVISWYEMLEKVKKFIDTNNARPTRKNNKELQSWMHTQIQNSKKRHYIMKDDEIYNAWNEFINDARYRQYFDLDNVRDWKNRLEEVKQFIYSNNAKPKPKTNKELQSWMKRQIHNSKKRLQIMKIDEIYNEWNEFINDTRYRHYFD